MCNLLARAEAFIEKVFERRWNYVQQEKTACSEASADMI